MGPYVGVFLVSATGLVFQVAQTRLFSATLGYHLTYLVISVSLLGVGAGATMSTLFDGRPRRPATPVLGLLLAISCLVSLLIQTHVDPLAIPLLVIVAGAYVFGALPLTFASWVIVRTLARNPARSGPLYAADLAGAALGSIVAYLGVTPLGVPALYALASVLGGTAALSFRPASKRYLGAALVAVAVLGTFVAWGEELAPPRIGPGKDATILQSDVARLAARWDPLARVDVLGGAADANEAFATPDGLFVDRSYAGPLPRSIGMFLDLGVSTPILGGDLSALRSSLLAAPYAALAAPSVLVIGPGGGIDINNALLHGASRVDAVEVNRSVVSFMEGRFAGQSNDAYLNPSVRVFEDEARSFVRRSGERYDLIVMTVVDSYAALASGSYSVSESYLYTDEAFHDYFQHLSASGLVAAGRWYRDPPIEILRTVQVAARGFRSSGVNDAARHIMVLRQRSFGLVLAGRAAFDQESTEAIRRFARQNAFVVAFDPLSPSEPFASAISEETSAPVTDDRPFFFADEPTRRTEGEISIAYVILFVALASAAILAYLVLILPQRVMSPGMLHSWAALPVSSFALLAGLGFIAAEMILLQRLTLYLGQPALALSIGLAALLFGASVGSALSRRLGSLMFAALLSSALLASVLIVLTPLTNATLDQALPVRIVLASLSVAAAGVPLGAVFPQVLALAARSDGRLIQWAWALNGAASVVGAIVAIALAISSGFTAVGVVAVLCYLAIGSISVATRNVREPAGRDGQPDTITARANSPARRAR